MATRKDDLFGEINCFEFNHVEHRQKLDHHRGKFQAGELVNTFWIWPNESLRKAQSYDLTKWAHLNRVDKKFWDSLKLSLIWKAPQFSYGSMIEVSKQWNTRKITESLNSGHVRILSNL